MLKLKKVQILGFKSFCDRTEVVLPGEGVAAVVGPNGCGKSNISDAITWVLGEQSAKSLRGIKMEDVIFAGTRDRKPTGMAEVSLTLFDPTVYDGADDQPSEVETVGDWDESAVRAQVAAETEEAVAEVQPGNVSDGDGEAAEGEAAEDGTVAVAEGNAPEGEAAAAKAAPGNPVVLKIRRRKFNRTPTRAGEIVVTRRLFRTGESEYLLNGKPCRLRDIHDIFMGTGLGTESYAIIGQERIGQLLSSKPLDRRAIIEEAAGITRFKTKKRLAELRLESAKQNLARVNDIFDEVTRQMNSLKRQAAKAERYAALRDEMRTRLRIVLASRLSQMDAEQAEIAAQIATLTAEIDAQAAQVTAMDAEHTAGIEQGYALDTQAREAQELSTQAAVELERATARLTSNRERIAELTARMAGGEAERTQMRQQMDRLAGEREEQRIFLETAATETETARAEAQQKQRSAQDASSAVQTSEHEMEQHRRAGLEHMTRASNARNQMTQAEESLAGLERDAERLNSESAAAKNELESLGVTRGQMSMHFDGLTERLKSLETTIAELRTELSAKREEQVGVKQSADKLRAEAATLGGRVASLESLIRDHSYATDTVRNLFQANTGWKPMGVLAEFLEVDGQYEALVDEFLRDELNYIVVKTWDDAQAAMRLLTTDVEGRATLLVHPEDAQAKFSFARKYDNNPNITRDGVIPLTECIRVQEGFGKALEVILPKLRDGYIAPDAETARQLALENPDAFYLARTGECFHNVTITGGQPRAEGPLAIKRELRDTQQKFEECRQSLATAEAEAAQLEMRIAELSTRLESEGEARRDAEREAANQSASLRQMESEVARLERRLQEWTLALDRNRNDANAKREMIAQKQEEAAQFEQQRAALEEKMAGVQQTLETLRAAREAAQAEYAGAAAKLAALEERRRGAQASFEQTDRIHARQQQQMDALDQQLASAVGEREQREQECAQLAQLETQYAATRDENIAASQRLTTEAAELRTRMGELDNSLRALRKDTEAKRELRSERTAHAAKLGADLEHLEGVCVSDLGTEAALLRADETIVRLEAEPLAAEEEETRAMKQRLENMGPVNMMALDEYAEAQQRHGFLETQRKDLLDSIENTQQSIREIDEVSRARFDEAFEHINKNFTATFTKLFGGGQAFMKLTDQENAAESGVDIVASPPGKKLQNVLLLSGGEKALTALSLLVGIFLYQPAPFCVLDEVDAPLDETNVGRFSRLIEEMSSTTQFIVITHSKGTMGIADMIYGVTMQEPGVSKIVSVKLGGREQQSKAS